VYRSGDICQFEIWRPSREIPVGHGQTRVGYVVIAALGYWRVGQGARASTPLRLERST
jgi:hypothetical protein